MNNISKNQNEKRQIMRLAAQRQLYATAKTIFGWQIFLSVPVVIIFSFIIFMYPDLKAFAALWGIVVVLADVIILTPCIKKKRSEAAKIQELFDCDVLSIEWSTVKVGLRTDPELIKEQFDEYSKWKKNMPSLLNWYDPSISSLPIHVARIACQRTNCWWDTKQRQKYAAFICFALSMTFIIILFGSLGSKLSLEDLILKVLVPFAPAFFLGIKQYSEQIEAAERSKKLKELAERIWSDALNKKDDIEITIASRALQDEIFESRKKSPLVFDRVFKLFRDDYEKQMNHGIEELVSDAKVKLNLK